LNLYSEKFDTKKSYLWDKVIQNQVNIANKNLNISIKGRGFVDPINVINKLKNEDHILAARIQNESGIRIHEASLIKENQLRGLGKDPYNGKESGVIYISGKGGKTREVYVSQSTYNDLKERVMNGNDFKIGKSSYTANVKESALLSRQIYTGTHDFRHAWVQRRFAELAELGYSDNQCLTAVSEEIGHVRPDITEVYLI
jgi:integrase